METHLICQECGHEHNGSYSQHFCCKRCRYVWMGKKSLTKRRDAGTLNSQLQKARAKRTFKSVKQSPPGTCRFCGKECKNQNSLRNHERLCKSNPNRQHIEEWTHNEEWRRKAGKGHPPHNQFIKARELGLPVPLGTMKGKSGTWLGKKHTEEQKRKISETQKRNFRESGAASIWHTQLERRRSYAEQYFATIFTDAQQQYHVSRYFLDFAWPDKRVYVEVDGEQHYNDPKVVAHDIERTKNLEECGWRCIARIRWAKFMKLSEQERKEFVAKIFSLI